MLVNKTQNKTIIDNVKFANSYFKKFKGLMFERKKNFNYALVFEFEGEQKMRASIHMMFVFFPIDAIYLNKGKKVVDIKLGLKPFTLNYTPKGKARYLIELPKGTANEIKLGDQLNWP